LIEVFHLYGCQLLLLDKLIPDLARERIVICYYRYKAMDVSDNVQQVMRLCKSTGYKYSKKTKRETIPKEYPLEYFARF
jgi:hypothetical protein